MIIQGQHDISMWAGNLLSEHLWGSLLEKATKAQHLFLETGSTPSKS